MFAALTVAISLASSRGGPVRLLSVARQLGTWAAVTLTALSLCVAVSWYDVYAHSGLFALARLAPAVGIAIGIVAQPIFAWRLAASLW